MASYKYRPSGKVPFWGVLYYLFHGLIFGGLLMALYTYGMVISGNLALRTAVVAVTIFLYGRMFRHFAKRGKFRSGKAAFGLALAVMLILYYLHLTAYSLIVEDAWQTEGLKSFLSLQLHFSFIPRFIRRLIDPLTIFKILKQVMTYGFWSLNGKMVTGPLLLFFQIVEFLIFVIYPGSCARMQTLHLFDEASKQWLEQRVDFTTNYIPNHRMLRRQLLKGDQDGLKEIYYQEIRNREPYGIIRFYHHDGAIGPFVSIWMVKNTQIGKNRFKKTLVPVLKECSIADEVEPLFKKLLEGRGTTYEKVTRKKHWNEKHFWKLRKEQVQYRVQQNRDLKAAQKPVQTETVPEVYENGEEVAKIEEVTVYTPTITPEMEQEYMAQQEAEEAERRKDEWKANKEALKKHKASKRRSSHIR